MLSLIDILTEQSRFIIGFIAINSIFFERCRQVMSLFRFIFQEVATLLLNLFYNELFF
jgi:hypothetical protein